MKRRNLLALAGVAALHAPARAAASQVRLSHGYGILYLPLMVMRDRRLLEAAMAASGLPPAEVSWQVVDGGNVINDAMLAGALDIAGTGAPAITLWAKARGIPRAEVVGLCGLSTCALSLNTNRPGIKTLADFTPADKIALPGIKTSLAAVVLQMLVAQKFGQAEYARLDPMTVGLAHPDAYGALMGGKTEVAAHFASPPYSILELRGPPHPPGDRRQRGPRRRDAGCGLCDPALRGRQSRHHCSLPAGDGHRLRADRRRPGGGGRNLHPAVGRPHDA